MWQKIHKPLFSGIETLFILLIAGGLWVPAVQAEDSPLDLRSIPISDWLNTGEQAEIPWDFQVSDPYLRIDQRIEVGYTIEFGAKALNQAGNLHELFFVSRISSPDGEWLEEPNISRYEVSQELPKRSQVQFSLRVCVQPGEYLLWVVLYDRKSGKHNVGKRRIRVTEFRGDPLPDLYAGMPLVEFPRSEESDPLVGFVRTHLNLPVHNRHPLQVQVVSTLNPPEQWTGRARVLRMQNDVTIGAIALLSQLHLAGGSLSITGLDLTRRQVLFEDRNAAEMDWSSFSEAFKKAQTPELSAKALQESKNNGVFFRDFLSQQIEAANSAEGPTRIVILVTSSQLFERGSDLTPIRIEGECHCHVYHLRFRLNRNDVFDEIEKIIKPLHPRTFNLGTSMDVRKAIAEIINDLEKF